MKGLNKTFLPISYDITGKTILILGGGKDAIKKIKILKNYTNNFLVVARKICEEIRSMKKKKKNSLQGSTRMPYQGKK